jgi:hypothetical protein
MADKTQSQQEFHPPSGVGWEKRGETQRINHPRRDAYRSEYGRGEWDNEPDRVEWFDAATGMPCLIVRNPMGALCGYVGVPAGHPYFGKDYNAVGADAHGGLTYAAPCQPGGGPICHAGEDERWWFGFDCGHLGDTTPGLMRYGLDYGSSYKDIGYVRSEVERLADQLREVANG